MRLPKFEYRTPTSLNEAISILEGEDESTIIIAGGTDIIPGMKQRRISPACLVNIKKVSGLTYIANGKDSISIGSLTTLNTIEESPLIKEKIPMLSMAAGMVGAPQHRNAGTIGGNICLNTRCWYYNQSDFFRKCRPVCHKFGEESDKCQLFPSREGKKNSCYAVYSGDTVPSLIVLHALVKIMGPDGERIIPLENFYTGDGKIPNILGANDILTDIIVPVPQPYSSGIYLKYRVREAIDFPLLGVAANITLDSKDGICKSVALVIGAVGPKPIIIKDAPKILNGNIVTEELIDEVSEAAFKAAKPLPNLLGCSQQYRKRLAKVFTKRAITMGIEKIKSI